jgi:hypothetical protein
MVVISGAFCSSENAPLKILIKLDLRVPALPEQGFITNNPVEGLEEAHGSLQETQILGMPIAAQYLTFQIYPSQYIFKSEGTLPLRWETIAEAFLKLRH